MSGESVRLCSSFPQDSVANISVHPSYGENLTRVRGALEKHPASRAIARHCSGRECTAQPKPDELRIDNRLVVYTLLMLDV